MPPTPRSRSSDVPGTARPESESRGTSATRSCDLLRLDGEPFGLGLEAQPLRRRAPRGAPAWRPWSAAASAAATAARRTACRLGLRLVARPAGAVDLVERAALRRRAPLSASASRASASRSLCSACAISAGSASSASRTRPARGADSIDAIEQSATASMRAATSASCRSSSRAYETRSGGAVTAHDFQYRGTAPGGIDSRCRRRGTLNADGRSRARPSCR